MVVAIDREGHQVVSGPDIISRGFVYVRESEDLMGEMREIAMDTVNMCLDKNALDWNTIKTKLRNEVGGFIFNKTKRKPMILPVIMDV